MAKYFGREISSGITVLTIGVVLLLFTFISAGFFLSGNLQIITSEDIAQTFGDALSPLIETSIRVMYLGVMGWIGSIITIRGVSLMTNQTEKIQTIQPSTQQLSLIAKNASLEQTIQPGIREKRENARLA